MMPPKRPLLAVLSLFACLGLHVAAQETKVVFDFESDADLKFFEFKNKSAAPSDAHVTHGKHSVKIAANEYLNTSRMPRDWSAFDAVEMDVFVEGDTPVSGSVLVADAIWDQSPGRSYWNRHNATFTLRPGANVITIPVGGLYRGEAGSRNNDIKSNIDPKQITRLDIGFSTKDKQSTAAVYLDHLRFAKESRPPDILAFDLGPAGQTVAPGFTPINPTTVYGQNGNVAGLSTAGSAAQARADTFPTALYRDYISMDGSTFVADVPEKTGKYHGWVVYDDLGYWGGEAAPYRKRSIVANNVPVVSEDRGDAGPTDYLYRFEKIEPHPGDNLWDLYAGTLFQPRRFECTSEDGKIRLKFTADTGLSCKVAAIVLYPDSIKAEAEKWVAQVEARNRAEFESWAVYLGPKMQETSAALHRMQGKYELGIQFLGLEADVLFSDAIRLSPPVFAKRYAVPGQRVSFTFTALAVQNFDKPVELVAETSDSKFPVIPPKEVDLRYVQHAVHRNANDIAYTIGPDTLRPVSGANLKLVKGITRQFWVTVHVPEDLAPGTYAVPVNLTAAGGSDPNMSGAKFSFVVEVLPFTLDEPDFSMGFFGTDVPRAILATRGDDAWRELFAVLRQAGMNSFSGGPNIRFSGFDAAGKPMLDFGPVDHFMKLAREAGFTKELSGYGGPGLVTGLHDSHAIGETGRAWEKKTGKPFGEILAAVWSAVRDHAKENNWLPIAVSMIDEPRVIDQARANLELIKRYREHAPWVNVGGSYSVDWMKRDAFETTVQELFKNAKWSSLNLHDKVDLDKAKEFGNEIQIYNQGRNRYSFGAFQWAEMRKGVKSRMQWHLLALHGYQFFDLDGREPDTAMINWTSQGIVPNIALHRCREGADDFRYAVTLWNLAQKDKSNPAAQEAMAWLENVSRQIPLNARKRPEGFMDDETFRNTCVERILKIRGRR